MSKPSQNRYVTVTELCDLIGISKNRFYALQKAGIFPAALRSALSNRRVYDTALVEQCFGVVRNRVGANGVPYVPQPQESDPKLRAPQEARRASRGSDRVLGLTRTYRDSSAGR